MELQVAHEYRATAMCFETALRNLTMADAGPDTGGIELNRKL